MNTLNRQTTATAASRLVMGSLKGESRLYGRVRARRDRRRLDGRGRRIPGPRVDGLVAAAAALIHTVRCHAATARLPGVRAPTARRARRSRARTGHRTAV